MTQNTTYYTYLPTHYHTGLLGFEVQMLVPCFSWRVLYPLDHTGPIFYPSKTLECLINEPIRSLLSPFTPTTSCWCESTSGIVDTTFWGEAGDSTLDRFILLSRPLTHIFPTATFTSSSILHSHKTTPHPSIEFFTNLFILFVSFSGTNRTQITQIRCLHRRTSCCRR